MADIKKVNVGGLDYNVKDDTARTNASTALSQLAYQETGNTASQAYATIGTPINWKGTLYFTKTAVASGTAWAVGTNLTAATNLGKLTSTIKTYVNGSGQLVFRDLTGADTVLPFSGTSACTLTRSPLLTSSTPYIRITISNIIECDESFIAANGYPANILNCCTLSYVNNYWVLTTTKANVVIDDVARASGFSLSWVYNADVTHTIKAP